MLPSSSIRSVGKSDWIPPSHFHRSLHLALRCGIASLAAVSWSHAGPLKHRYSFFQVLIAMVVCQSNLGASMHFGAGAMNGVAGGFILGFITVAIAQGQKSLLGILFFVDSFLMVSHSGFTPFGRKLGLETLILGVIGLQGLPLSEWALLMGSFALACLEGCVWATLACLVPPARLAAVEGTYQAGCICFAVGQGALLSAALFSSPGDERIGTQLQLNIEHLRREIEKLRALAPLARVELGALYLGQRGGLAHAESLDTIVENMLPRIHCLEGMYEAARDLGNQQLGDEHSGFIAIMGGSLVESMGILNAVLLEVTDVLFAGFGAPSGQLRAALSPLLAQLGSAAEGLLTAYRRARFAVLYNARDTVPHAPMNDTLSCLPSDHFLKALSMQNILVDKGGQKDALSKTVGSSTSKRFGGLSRPASLRDFPPRPSASSSASVNHEDVQKGWATKGFAQQFARGCFMFNAVTLLITAGNLFRLSDKHASRSSRGGWGGLVEAASVLRPNLSLWAAMQDCLTVPASPRQWPAAAWAWLKMKTAALKLAFILTVCACMGLITSTAETYQPAFWIAMTVGFVMSADNSSGFATAMSRLLGSCVGAMYGWIAAQLLLTDSGANATWRLILAIVPWATLCCFFKSAPTFGYAALVAGFTPSLIIMGSFAVTKFDSNAAFIRIENTMIGVTIYVVLDNLIFPKRAKLLLLCRIAKDLLQITEEAKGLGSCLFVELDSMVTADPTRTPGDLSPASDMSQMPLQGGIMHGRSNSGPPGIRSSIAMSNEEAHNSSDDAVFAAALCLSNPSVAEALLSPLGRSPLARMAAELREQERLLDLAASEPILWHRPFHRPSYNSFLRAERKLVFSLSLLARATTSLIAIRRQPLWSNEWEYVEPLADGMRRVCVLGYHALSETHVIFSALESAGGHLASVPASITGRALHLIELEEEADRVFRGIDSGMVQHMQRRCGSAPLLSSQFALRFNTASFGVSRLRASMLLLAKSVLALLEREGSPFLS
jgi:hypothetical protein